MANEIPISFPISILAAHGFSQRLISRWEETGVRRLLPLQALAAQEYAFLHRLWSGEQPYDPFHHSKRRDGEDKAKQAA